MKIDQPKLQSIYSPIEDQFEDIKEEIYRILSTRNEMISQVARYFFSKSGKMMRPALCLLGASLGKPDWNEAKRVAASFEIFHSASLIHDDIIDGSILRRNMPTVPVKWGPQISVLVGDYFQDRAMHTVYSTRKDRLISLFLNTVTEVCDGEILEIKEHNNFDLAEGQYFEIIEKKTAALFGACIEAGGILGKLNSEECASLKKFGLNIGIAFQIVDDCLDFSGDRDTFGKRPGGDAESGVLTLPLIRLLNLVPANKKSEVFSLFKSFDRDEKLEYLIRLMEEYDTLNYAFEKAREYTDNARLELSTFPDSPTKTALLDLTDYIIKRSR